jgi:smad nuclear-interacting protein 1
MPAESHSDTDSDRARRRDRRPDRFSNRHPPRSRSRSRDRSYRSHTSHTSHSKDKTRDHGSTRRRHRDASRSKSPSSSSKRPTRRSTDRSPGPLRKQSHHDRRHAHSRSPSPFRRSQKPLPSQESSFHGTRDSEGQEDRPKKEKPNFANTGLLARESNTVAGTSIVLKYNEPADARTPPASQEWRLYIFKGSDVADTVPIYSQSCWLLGREKAVTDLFVEHPSTSKQHAVIQFRSVAKTTELGDRRQRVKPYLIDLESSNGTFLNGDRIEAKRFIEIRDRDVMKIGLSDREYVFMLPPAQ